MVFYDGVAGVAKGRMPVLLSLNDGVTTIMFYFQGTGLICRINSPSTWSGATLIHAFPRCQWTRTVIVVDRDSDDSTLVAAGLGGGAWYPFSVTFRGFKDGPFPLTLGGLYDESPSTTEHVFLTCHLGPFRFYPHPIDQDSVRDSLTRQHNKFDDSRPFLFVYPPLPGFVQPVLTMPALMGRVRHNILDSLGQIEGLRSVVPFFLYLAEMPPHFPELVIDVLQAIIPHCPEAICEHYYFPAIGQMLRHCPTERLTYGLYLKFFGFLESSTDPIVVASLFVHILFDFDIWCVADSSHLVRIVLHGSTSLFVTAPTALSRSFAFSDLLAFMRVHFWYEPVELDIIRGAPNSERPRSPGLDVDACRGHLARLALALSSRDDFPSAKDLQGIAYHCVCPDRNQAISFFSLFVQLALEHPNHVLLSDEASVCLCERLNPQDTLHFVRSIEFLAVASGPSFYTHLHSVLANLKPSSLTPELCDRCIELLARYPAIHPLCTLVALTLGGSSAIQLAEALGLIRMDVALAIRIIQDPLWCVWPVLLLNELPGEHHHFVFTFVLSVLASPGIDILYQLGRVLDGFDLVAFHTSYAVEAISKRFLARAGPVLFDGGNPEVISRCIMRLLIYINEPPDAAIPVLFSASPFGNRQRPQSPLTPKIRSLSDVFTVFCGPAIASSYHFGLKLSPVGTPLDSELFAATVGLLRLTTPDNEMLSFWRSTLTDFAQRRRNRSPSLLVNQMAPIYFQKVVTGQIEQLCRLREEIARRFGGVPMETTLPSLPMTQRAADDLNQILEAADTRESKNARRMKRVMKANIHPLSPWSTGSFVANVQERIFQYCAQRSQPLIRWKKISLQANAKGLTTLRGLDVRFCLCTLVKINRDIPAMLSEVENVLQIVLPNRKMAIPDAELTRVLHRVRFHTHICVELFTRQRRSFLLDFGENPAAQAVISDFKILSSHRSDVELFHGKGFTQEWIDGDLSSFEYLMTINEFSGRSFRDSTIYPIFPWVVASDAPLVHSASTIHAFFRDLSRPMAAQSGEQNICYCTAPSRPAVLAYFLGRCAPFASLAVHNPIPETFTSMQDAVEFAIANSVFMELCPEFFFGAEYFQGDFTLPAWASNSHEFVYTHRKILESEEVSQHLHRWIDLIFGVSATTVFASMDEADERSAKRNGSMPLPLFSQSHPGRRPALPRKSRLQSAIVRSSDRQNLMWAHVITATASAVTFFAIQTDNCLFCAKIRFLSNASASQTVVEGFPVTSLRAGFHGGVIALDEARTSLVVGQKKSVLTEPLSMSGVEHIAVHGQTIVLLNRGGQVFASQSPSFQSWRLVTSVTSDYCCALAVNDPFATMAIGTRDGHVVLSSSIDGLIRCACDVGGPPRKILITNGWGFVFVETAGALWLFTINGALLRRVPMDFTISAIETWACERGCDFIAIAAEGRQIRIFEAFFLQIDQFVFTAGENVLAMKYILRSRALAIVTVGGDLVVFPWDLPEF
jgi:hypothetical protein